MIGKLVTLSLYVYVLYSFLSPHRNPCPAMPHHAPLCPAIPLMPHNCRLEPSDSLLIGSTSCTVLRLIAALPLATPCPPHSTHASFPYTTCLLPITLLFTAVYTVLTPHNRLIYCSVYCPHSHNRVLFTAVYTVLTPNNRLIYRSVYCLTRCIRYSHRAHAQCSHGSYSTHTGRTVLTQRV